MDERKLLFDSAWLIQRSWYELDDHDTMRAERIKSDLDTWLLDQVPTKFELGLSVEYIDRCRIRYERGRKAVPILDFAFEQDAVKHLMDRTWWGLNAEVIHKIICRGTVRNRCGCISWHGKTVPIFVGDKRQLRVLKLCFDYMYGSNNHRYIASTNEIVDGIPLIGMQYNIEFFLSSDFRFNSRYTGYCTSTQDLEFPILADVVHLGPIRKTDSEIFEFINKNREQVIGEALYKIEELEPEILAHQLSKGRADGI